MSAVLAAVLTGAAILVGCGDEEGGETITLRYSEPAKGGESTPIGQSGTGYRISRPLQDRSRKTVGKIVGVCLGERDDGACKARAILADGRISFGIVVRREGDDIGSISGGTGRYAGATGTFLSEEEKDGSSRHTFR